MFFILSKVLYFLLSPWSWIIGFIIAAVISKSARRKKRFYILAVVFALFFSIPIIHHTVTYNWQLNEATIKKDKKYTAGILLCGIVGFDKNEKGYFGFASDRFIQTLKLYNQKRIDKIVITGGSGSLFRPQLNEAAFLRKEFIANNVPDSNIIIESASRNTNENAVFTKRTIDSLHLSPPFLLITSATHMRRSLSCFRHAGIDPDHYPTSYEAKKQKITIGDFIPDPEVISYWQRLLKEIVGTYAYKLTGKA
jgi:uncharacterized SAM-binding protein YcdF (DUF218 family)